MNEIIKVVLSLSVSGTLLLLLIFTLKGIYKDKFSKCWQYYIWLLAALRFLFPFSAGITVTGYMFSTFDRPVLRAVPADETMDDIANTGRMNPTDTQMNGAKVAGALPAAPQNSVDFGTYLFFGWFALALALAVRKITIYQSFMRYLKAGSTQVSDVEMLNLLAGCEEKLNVKKPVELYYNPLIASPIMTGFFHPAIIIPAGQTKKEALYYIFTHELIHYKRHDMIYKWLIQLVISIHWFNPFVYLLGREINRACELSCDEAVLKAAGGNGKKAYGDILISSIKAERTYKNSLASVTLTEGAELLKERLGAIMNFKKLSKTITVVTGFATLLLCVCFNLLGAYAKTDGNPGSTGGQNLEKHVSNKNTGSHFLYTQNGYYQDAFIIEMGWNLFAKPEQAYASQVEIRLADSSKMTVYFSKAAEGYSKDNKAVTAIGKLIDSIKSENTRPVIEQPLIISITAAPIGDIPALAQTYFENNNLIKFSAVFPVLDKKDQEAFLEKIYDADKIALFSMVAQDMDEDLISLYADRAEQDNKIEFFAIILDYIQNKDLKQYAEKYYEKDNIAGFTLLIDYMTEEEKEDWLGKALRDNKITFYIVISDGLSESKYFH